MLQINMYGTLPDKLMKNELLIRDQKEFFGKPTSARSFCHGIQNIIS